MTTIKPPKPRFTLTLEAPARGQYDAAGTMRLKRLLKALLRRYSLRCVSVRRTNDDAKRLT